MRVLFVSSLVIAGAVAAWWFFWPAVAPISEDSALVFSLAREPDSLIPILSSTEESVYVSELVFDGLINRTVISSTGRALYSKGLCQRFQEESATRRREITLKLAEGAMWHNGIPFSADDVLFTWDALHASNSPIVGWLDSLVEEIYKVDDDEIHLTLKVERSEEALNEILSTFKILPRIFDGTRGEEGKLPLDLREESGVVNDFNYQPVGTGPYRITGRRGNRIELERNDNYFLGPPKVPKLVLQRMEAPELAVKALSEGGLDLLLDVRPHFFEALGAAPVRAMDYTPYGFYALVYNTRRAPFNSSRYRAAISAATDKNGLFAPFTGLRDSQDFINTSIYPHNYEFVERDPQAYSDTHTYSAARARSLLGGESGRGFTLLLSSELQGEGARRLAQTYVQMLQEVGVDVQIDDQNQVSFDGALRERDFDVVFVEFAGLNHLYDFRSLFGDGNVFGISDSRLAALLQNYGKTFALDELETISKQIHVRVDELAPACFLFTTSRRAYMDDHLRNVSIHPEVGFATVERWDREEQE